MSALHLRPPYLAGHIASGTDSGRDNLENRRFRLLFGLLAAVSLLLSACQTATIVPSPTPTAAIASTSPSPTLAPSTPIATVTAALSATSTPTLIPKSIAGQLAFLEIGLLTILDLQSGQSAQVEGQFQRLTGWSPGGAYLLALRSDGASIVVDAAGKILSALEGLPQPAFWAAPKDASSAEDWLAVPGSDGALGLLSFPSLETKTVYEPGSLGADGMAFVRWGSNGEAILTPTLSQLQNKVSFEKGYFAWMLQNGPDGQYMALGGEGGFGSADFHKTYFQVLDSVPGSSSPYVVLGFQVPNGCSSCSLDGLKLVSLDAWSGKVLPLGAVLLYTPEAYAWNPAQPGLMALAEGGSRFTLENKRLALLDALAGTLRILTGPNQVAYEPSWSPDGLRLAYTTMPAREGASGSGEEMEALLGGRAIAVHEIRTGVVQTLTHPAKDEIDGWPRWAADGKMLLYARKLLAASTTQVRQLDLVTGEDRPVVTISGAPQACFRLACDWGGMLAYSPGKSAKITPPPVQVLDSTPTAVVQTNIPSQGMTTYHDPAYGFSFQYPASWKLTQAPNFLHLLGPQGVLNIGYRRATQQAQIQRTGVGEGDFVAAGTIQFQGKTLQRSLLVYEGKVKEVFYQNDREFSVGDLVFTLGLGYSRDTKYEDVDIPKDVQAEADQILESFVIR